MPKPSEFFIGILDFFAILLPGVILTAILAPRMLLVLPCFARYYERRLKSTTQAYIHVLTLHRLGDLSRRIVEECR